MSSSDTIRRFLEERMDPDFGLLSILLAKKTIGRREMDEVKSKRTLCSRNSQLLDYILAKDQGDGLKAALGDADQIHIVNYLIANGEYSNEFGEDWPLTEKEISILDTNDGHLVDLLELSDLLGRLYSSGVINERQMESISSKPTSHGKNEALLNILRRRSLRHYRKAIACLHQSQQSHIAEILDEGGVVVRAHINLYGENVTEEENEIVTMIASIFIDRSIDEPSRILGLISKVIAAKTGQSIVLYIYCKTITDLEQLNEELTSGRLKNSVEMWFNSLSTRPKKVIVASLTISTEDFPIMRTYFQDEETSRRGLKRRHSDATGVSENLSDKQPKSSVTDYYYEISGRDMKNRHSDVTEVTEHLSDEHLKTSVTGSSTNEELKHGVRKVYAKFVLDVDPDRLSDWLVQEEVITVDEKQRIRNTNHSAIDRCRALLDYLLTSQHPRAFVAVRQALRESSRYMHLLESIENQKPECGIDVQHHTTLQDIVKTEQGEDKSESLSGAVSGCKSNNPASPYYLFRQQMKEHVVADLTYMLKDETYSKIQKIIERPHIKEDEISQFWKIAFPYIIQRIKMWNGYVLTAHRIADFVTLKRKEKQKQKKVTTGSQIFGYRGKPLQSMEESGLSVYPVSRLDFLTYLINAADCIVAHDILQIISKFPMAVPLIVQDIHEDDKYIVTVPILRNILIKWESAPGLIVENHLFSSPFRMVAAIRLGTNKIGKSTILNQLMSKEFLFSSKGESGSRYGRPSTLDGAVEIVWLTQATCSSPTWRTPMSEYYSAKADEVIILANLHGNALYNNDILTYLKKYVCSFIVFLMPDFSDKEWTQLKRCIKSKNIVQVLVDPKEQIDDDNNMNTVRTESLSSDDTLDTMRCLLQQSLNFKTKKRPTRMEEKHHAFKSLRYAKSLHCTASAEIVTIVRRQGCFNIKQLLSKADFKQLQNWDRSLKRLINLSLDILSLPTKDAKEHLAHLETNLSQISSNESMAVRAEVSEAKKKLRSILKLPNKTGNEENSKDRETEEDLKEIKQELETAMDKFDNMNVGQEHIFRILGDMYENSLEVTNLGEFTAVRDLPNHFANLLIHGHAIEVLNGDSGKIQLIWIRAICDNVLKNLTNLKVFVISIIGLQSSGKSTLLNALFSCRFAVSVGRCSRGLFMRMIFLDETLKSSHGYDAIILIDTEGLSSPEKMNDPKANQKDRLMATYAMGISNLTIVNILGEGLTEMTEILQIAIVAMARLRVGGIKPDILMVQHLQERNIPKMDQAKDQFREAINKAFELINKSDVEIGSASAECLDELTTRIHSGNLFQHFGPFKDGSSVNSPPSESYHDDVISLLEKILKLTKVSNNKCLFERWCIHLESYWTCVQEETFALNFKNVKHITDFLYFEKKIAKVKELVDRATRYHREIYSSDIRREVSSQIMGKGKTGSMQQRERLLERFKRELNLIPSSCPANCEGCTQFNASHAALLEELSNTEWMEDTKRSLETYNTRLREITMKTLGQTFDGSLVRQGCFSEFSDQIETELKKALLKRPSGIYVTEEQEKIIKDIWGYLQDIARKMEGEPNLEAKFTEILQREYSGIFPTFLKDFEKEITIDHLANSNAIKSFWDMNLKRKWEFVKHHNYKLSEDQFSNLISAINQLIDTVFRHRCVDFCKTGLDFEEGMVSYIRSEFPEVNQQFENRFCMKLHDNFKINLQMYALQQFKKNMMELQKLWDSQNKPTEILKQKRQDYITEIETRLKSGFSSAGEGQVVAAKLYNAMKKKATQAGYEEKVQLIKDMSWTTNSEKVRLCYFEELAKEVQAGKKERALRHFNNPKNEIEKWYKQRVDSFDTKDEVMKVYESTLKTELNLLTRKISNCATKVEIKQIVEEHIIKAGDDQYYSQLVPNGFDFGAFKDSITHELTSSFKLHDRKNIVFPLSSYDSEIMDRLGCTEHCYWCGALCWGSRGHQLGKDRLSEMEAHHSCHQPSGLKGVTDRRTKKLISTACHNRTDGWRVWFGEYQDDEGMLWSEAKLNHFNDWKFDVHHIKRFDELMRWFFQELHHDIAQRRNMLPADETDLKENKCENLEFQDILNYVRHKI